MTSGLVRAIKKRSFDKARLTGSEIATHSFFIRLNIINKKLTLSLLNNRLNTNIIFIYVNMIICFLAMFREFDDKAVRDAIKEYIIKSFGK